MGKKRVGFIGLGKMGRPMATNILKAGHPLTVYDVVGERMEPLVQLGAVRADSPAAVAAASEVVITMLTSTPHVEEVILGPQGVLQTAREGLIIIEMSTIDPAATRRCAELAAARGVRMMDAPVGKGEPQAREGTLTIMAGGDPELLEECRDILAVMGSSIYHCGPVGSGEMVKLVNNLMTGIISVAVAEATVLGAKAGISPELMLEVIGASGASNWQLQNFFVNKAFKGNFEPGFMVNLMHKDLGLALQVADRLGVSLMAGSLSQQLFGICKARGMGEECHTAVIKLFEGVARTQVRLKGTQAG